MELNSKKGGLIKYYEKLPTDETNEAWDYCAWEVVDLCPWKLFKKFGPGSAWVRWTDPASGERCPLAPGGALWLGLPCLWSALARLLQPRGAPGCGVMPSRAPHCNVLSARWLIRPTELSGHLLKLSSHLSWMLSYMNIYSGAFIVIMSVLLWNSDSSQ